MKSLNQLFLVLPLVLAQAAAAGPSDAWQLLPQAQVDSAGVFLDEVVVSTTVSTVIPHLRLSRAPTLGQTVSLSRTQITELVQKQASELFTTNWLGATFIHVSRRTRQFSTSDLTDLLTAQLQQNYVKNRGELELHPSRPWITIPVPDEPITMKVIELPQAGVTPTFVTTFELWCGKENLGSWQVALTASIWRDVPVARSPLRRGDSLRDSDIAMERRDVLQIRDAFLNYPPKDDTLELAEAVQPEAPVLNRSVRQRPLILRGRIVEAVFQDGTLSISLQVETLEDGLLGQIVRVRNPKTKRELYGKVQNEQTVLIAL